MLTLSLVIPVYNEERHLKACLEAVAKQAEMPDEVLVIDNNSTDHSVAIAKSFPFVRVVHESKQGLIAARNRGFQEATSDILARIDADAQIAPNWVRHMKQDFGDSSVAAVTGLARTHVLPGREIKTRLWSLMYFLMREADFKIYLLWGANMALRRSAWQHIKNRVCLDDSQVHEDQDLSFLLVTRGLRIKRDNNLMITTPGDEYAELPKFVEYMKRAKATKRRHSSAMQSDAAKDLQLLPMERLWRALVVAAPGLVFLTVSMVLYIFNISFSKRYARAEETNY